MFKPDKHAMTNAGKIEEGAPRPWYVRRGNDTNDAVGIGAHSKGAAGGWVGLHVAELPVGEATNANAALIVRAVNSYDPALQDKLTKAVKALEQCATPFTLPNIDDLSGDALEKSVAIFRCLVEHALAVQTAANTVLRSIKESE